jgi:hypothetical protein
VLDDWHTIDACPNYNPFVPSSSICGGTFKMCQFRGSVRAFIDSDAGLASALGVSGVDLDDLEYRWAEVWATLLAYNAGPGGFLNYYENWKAWEGCYDYNGDGYYDEYDTGCCAADFVEYVNTCPLGEGGNPYAAQVIAKYDTILKTCPSNCPDGVTEFADDPLEGQDFTPASIDCTFLNDEYNPYLLYPHLYMGLTPPVSGGSCSGLFCTDRGTHYHGGIDIGVPVGTPIVASHSGTVYNAYDPGGGGNYVRLEGDELKTYYMHVKCGGFALSSGTYVNEGEVIAYSGGADSCRGRSSGPHLHYEVRTLYNAKMDPAYFVDICAEVVSPP